MRTLWFCIIAFSLAPLGRAQEKSTDFQLDPLPQLLATTRTFAENHKIDINGIRGSRIGSTEPGDSSTLLISLRNKQLQQYLVTLEVVALDDQDRARKLNDTNVYLSTGSHFVYRYVPVALNVTTYGPFAEKSGATETPKTAHVLVSGDHLALGFDNSCRAFLRIRDYRSTQKDSGLINIGFQNKPFPTEVVEKMKRARDELRITPAEEKSLAGTMPAILSFFQLAQNTPGLREILEEVIDLPSAWSIVKHGGVHPNIGFQGGGTQDVGSITDRNKRFYLPLEIDLNNQKSLDVGMVVTAAQPPLLTTAGIEAIYAKSPSQHERTAYLEVIGTHLAPETVTTDAKR